MHTDRQREKLSHRRKVGHTEKHIDSQTGQQGDRQRSIYANRWQTDRQTCGQTERQTSRQTAKERVRQMGRHRDRLTDKR